MTITLAIVILTCLVSFSAFSNEKLMNDLIFYPPAVAKNKQWYRFFSCGLLHGDFAHLIFNMYALYLFGDGRGSGVEHSFTAIFGGKGKLLYLLMYILALGACLIPTYVKNKDNYHYRSLGASGAVSAVVFVQILLNPMNGIGLIFIPNIYIAGFLFGVIYLVISHWLDRRGGGNINHSAHIYGAIFGIAFIIVTAQLFSDRKVLADFINTIRNASLSDIFIVG
jgi:membrane associated rhomboid family serine protease